MSLLDYERRFSALRVNRARGKKSPHKVSMLLAIIDLLESGAITQNRFHFDEPLKQRFKEAFTSVASSGDRNNPHLPFYHLRNDGFWHHRVRPGQREHFETLTTASSPGIIDAHIEYAFLDDELFELLGNQVARELLKSALLTNLDDQTIRDMLRPERGGWDWLECEFLVSEYMAMLEKQFAGVYYRKVDHRRALQKRLNNRSDGSIEYKHQNVSAVLLELGLPYIVGYKPAFNYQQQLKRVVLSWLAGHQHILEDVGNVAEKSGFREKDTGLSWSSVFDPEPPERLPRIAEDRPSYLARHVDFAERERRNRQLGERAEEFVLRLEKQRLVAEGRSDLANEVEWSSKKEGDGLGYDIRSFDAKRDQERYLEVKATHSGKYQPFFVSENERAFSSEYSDAFRLYRVYEFGMASRIFVLPGAIEQHVHLQPQSYRARF